MKYFSKKIRNEYGVFDSKAEYRRYIQLKQMEDSGIIFNLKTQVEFEVLPKLMKTIPVRLKTKVKYIQRVDERPIRYTADFCYTDRDGKYIIEEVKSYGTLMVRDYPLRRKLIKHLIARHNSNPDNTVWVFNEIVST